jgi:hypothetical protein
MYTLQLRKRNMLVNLKIGFNNNLITNSFCTKFLVVTTDNTLFWSNHIDLLMKKLSTTCYIIRNAIIHMFILSLKIIYHAFFYLTMSYRIIFFGNSLHSLTVFRMQRKVIRIMEECGNRVSCRNFVKKVQILPLTSQYLLSLLMFVVQKQEP